MTAQTSPAWVPEPPRDDTFGARLRLLRLALGDISVQEAARRCGIPTPTWRSWEHGAFPQRMGDAVRLLHDKTGVDMAWLIWGTAAAGPNTPTEQDNPLLGWNQQIDNVTYLPVHTEPVELPLASGQ